MVYLVRTRLVHVDVRLPLFGVYSGVGIRPSSPIALAIQVSWPEDPESAEGKLVTTLQDEQSLLPARVKALKVGHDRAAAVLLYLGWERGGAVRQRIGDVRSACPIETQTRVWQPCFGENYISAFYPCVGLKVLASRGPYT